MAHTDAEVAADMQSTMQMERRSSTGSLSADLDQAGYNSAKPYETDANLDASLSPRSFERALGSLASPRTQQGSLQKGNGLEKDWRMTYPVGRIYHLVPSRLVFGERPASCRSENLLHQLSQAVNKLKIDLYSIFAHTDVMTLSA